MAKHPSELARGEALPELSPDFGGANSRVPDPVRGQRVHAALDRLGGILPASGKTGIAARTLKDYAAGFPMKLDPAAALARAAGVSLLWLATGEGPMVTTGLSEDQQATNFDAPASPTILGKRLVSDEQLNVVASALKAAETIFNPEGNSAEARLASAMVIAENFLETAGRTAMPELSLPRLALALEMIEQGDPDRRLSAQERTRYMLALYEHHEALIRSGIAPKMP